MEHAKTPPPPRVSPSSPSTDQALIAHYVSILRRMDVEKPSLTPPKLLSRPDVLNQIQELKDSVQACKQQRVSAFLGSKQLRHLMQDQLAELLLRTVRSSKESERPSFGPISKDQSLVTLGKEEALGSKLVFEGEKVSDFEEVVRDSGGSKEVGDVLMEMEQSQLEMELLDRQKLRVERRLRSATIRVVDTFSGYLNVAEPIYSDTTEFVYKKRWIAINSADVSLYTSSTLDECLLQIALPNVISVIDELSAPTSLKITFRDSDGDCGMMLSFYTDQAKTRCVEVMKVLAKSGGFEYVRSGALPSKTEEICEERRMAKRFSTFRKTAQLSNEPQQTEEIKEQSEEGRGDEEQNSQLSEEQLYISDEGEEPEVSQSLGLTPQGTLFTREEERPRSLTELAEDRDEKGLVNLLTKGGIFLKYGRFGGPKLRHVMVTADLKYIEWRPLNKPHYKSHSGLAVNTIKKVAPGRTTKRFRKFPNPSREDDSFSLVCTDRDLDLEVHKPGPGHNQKTWLAAFEKLSQGLLSRNDVERFIAKQHKADF